MVQITEVESTTVSSLSRSGALGLVPEYIPARLPTAHAVDHEFDDSHDVSVLRDDASRQTVMDSSLDEEFTDSLAELAAAATSDAELDAAEPQPWYLLVRTLALTMCSDAAAWLRSWHDALA